MRVRVLFFAGLRALVGEGSVDLQFTPGATFADIRTELGRRWPQAKGLVDRSFLALGDEYISDLTRPIEGDCEVACIPPVSGG